MSVALRRSNFDLVRQRLSGGDKVRLLQDFYGAQYAEIAPRWQFWRRKIRVRLDPDEYSQLESELRRAG